MHMIQMDYDEWELFKSKYEQLEKIGEGYHGVVYKVKSNSDGKLYAAKMIKTDEYEIQITV